MSMLNAKTPTFTDGRTKQSFKDETDINKILKRAQKTGTISHLNKYQARYADYSKFDFQENLIKLTEGRQIFDELPSELRNEFEGNPAKFFAYVNDPANIDDIAKRLPALAAPGRQILDVRGNVPADELAAAQAAEQQNPEPTAPEPTPTPAQGESEPTAPPA